MPEDGKPLEGEEVLLDGNELASGHEFFSLGALEVSPDVSAQARHDADFESLRDLESFRQLLDARVSLQSGIRRRSAARPDR